MMISWERQAGAKLALLGRRQLVSNHIPPQLLPHPKADRSQLLSWEAVPYWLLLPSCRLLCWPVAPPGLIPTSSQVPY